MPLCVWVPQVFFIFKTPPTFNFQITYFMQKKLTPGILYCQHCSLFQPFDWAWFLNSIDAVAGQDSTWHIVARSLKIAHSNIGCSGCQGLTEARGDQGSRCIREAQKISVCQKGREREEGRKTVVYISMILSVSGAIAPKRVHRLACDLWKTPSARNQEPWACTMIALNTVLPLLTQLLGLTLLDHTP